MENLEKFAFPAVVVAAVAGIYLAFRKQPAAPQGVVSGTTFSPASTYAPPQSAPSLSTIAPIAGPQGGSDTFNYIEAAGSNFYANNPVNPSNPNSSPSNISLPPQNPTAYFQIAAPPFQSFTKQVAAQLAPPPMEESSGGCGGCGGCGGGKNQCYQRAGQNNRFPDGRGGCLTTRPKVAGIQDALYSLKQYQQLFSPRTRPWNYPPRTRENQPA